MLKKIGERILQFVLFLVQKWPWANVRVNAWIINRLANQVRHRPHPWSTFSDYVCWTSLSNQQYSARHLPAVYLTGLPKPEDIVPLFDRPNGQQRLCKKSTCLFPAFAQYLTDGFIRTVMPKKDEPWELRKKNTSNHQIDMSPLYGRNDAQIACLRLNSQQSGMKGRLKSQTINGEEFSPFLFDSTGVMVPEFACLDLPLGLNDQTDPQLIKTLFAAGGDRINSSPQTAMMNTLFLREHNRLAGALEKKFPTWDDERVFQTARNIVIVVFIKIVVDEYINHIAPIPYRLDADPSVAWNAPWNKPNWITTEFSLLYRWHSLIPDTVTWGATNYPLGTTLLNNAPLISGGLRQGFIDMSSQKAGQLGARNTARAILSVEFNALKQGRVCNLAPYVQYRKYASLPVPKSFADISGDPAVVALLQSVYQSVDQVDFYAGIFAEDTVPNSPLPSTILALVAVDAFTQALTNPLLSEHVFKEETFSDLGWETIHATGTLSDILARNCPQGLQGAHVGMTQSGWRYS